MNKDEIDEIRDRLTNAGNRAREASIVYENWTNCWKALLDACQKHNAIGRWAKSAPKFIVDQPATEDEVESIEDVLGCTLPESFRRVLLTYSARVDISWDLQNKNKQPESLRKIFSGECRWNLQELPELMKTYQEWIDGCFSNPSDPYDAIWHNKFPIAEVGNGDMIGIDTKSQEEAVIYLSHEDGDGHGYRMGNNFEDFIDRIAQIGCPGYEDWQWLPFTSDKNRMIDPQSKNAKDWRQWFGLELPPKVSNTEVK